MATTPEGKVKKEIKKYLDEIGAWYYMPVSNGMGRVGCPDFIICYRGHFLAVEAKAPGKLFNVTPNQQREIEGIREALGLAIVADSVETVKEIIAARKALDRMRIDVHAKK